MSEENVEVVRGLLPAEGIDMVALVGSVARGVASAPAFDVRVFSEDCAVEFVAERPSRGDQAQPAWSAGLVEGWRNWIEAHESYVITPEDFLDAGDQVLLLVRAEARTERDGVTMEHRPAALFQVGDGRIHRARFYLDREMAFGTQAWRVSTPEGQEEEEKKRKGKGRKRRRRQRLSTSQLDFLR